MRGRIQAASKLLAWNGNTGKAWWDHWLLDLRGIRVCAGGYPFLFPRYSPLREPQRPALILYKYNHYRNPFV